MITNKMTRADVEAVLADGGSWTCDVREAADEEMK